MGAKLNTSAARARMERIRREAEMNTHLAIRRAADHALEVARSLAPGRIPATLQSRALNQYAVRISSTWHGAVWHENGTAPHAILPKNKLLVFQVNGATVFARRVQHPGTPAIHFMRRGMESAKVLLRALMKDILR